MARSNAAVEHLVRQQHAEVAQQVIAAAAAAATEIVAGKRPYAEVVAELAATRAEFKELHGLVEKDTAKIRGIEALRERVLLARQRLAAQGIEGDQLDYNPSLVVPPKYSGDQKMHKRFHGLHYDLAELERELKTYDEYEVAAAMRAEKLARLVDVPADEAAELAR